MSITSNTKLNNNNSLFDLYYKGVSCARKRIGSAALDCVEAVAVGLIPALSAYYGAVSELPGAQYFAATTLVLASVPLSFKLYERCLKAHVIEREIKEIVNRSKRNDQSALIVHPARDHTGALSGAHAVTKVYESCAQSYAIDRIRGLSYLDRHEVQGKVFDVILIFSHGASTQIDGGHDSAQLTKDAHKIMSFLFRAIKPGGKIILDACNAGKGEENIARSISRRIPHATVYASPTYVNTLYGVTYDPKDMTPTFYPAVPCLRGKTTRCYEKGALIDPRSSRKLVPAALF